MLLTRSNFQFENWGALWNLCRTTYNLRLPWKQKKFFRVLHTKNCLVIFSAYLGELEVIHKSLISVLPVTHAWVGLLLNTIKRKKENVFSLFLFNWNPITSYYRPVCLMFFAFCKEIPPLPVRTKRKDKRFTTNCAKTQYFSITIN